MVKLKKKKKKVAEESAPDQRVLDYQDKNIEPKVEDQARSRPEMSGGAATAREERIGTMIEGARPFVKNVADFAKAAYGKTIKTGVDQVMSDVDGIKKYGKRMWLRMKNRNK